MTHPIRYKRLGYAALQGTNLTASTHFYSELMGLKVERVDAATAWLRCSDKPHDLILEAGDTPGLSRIGFELESRAELTKAFDHVERIGLVPAWTGAASFRFRNPDTGLELEYYTDPPHAPTRFEPTVTQIVRLGHVVLNVANYADAHCFWVDRLGFEISDHVPGKIAFLRCWPNPLHHSLALLTGERDSLNHFNFMVTDIDDIGRAIAARLLAEGAAVMVCDLDPALAAQAAADLAEPERTASFGGNLARAAEARAMVEHALERFGRVDILVSKAGGGILRPFLDHTPQTLAETIDRNLWTAIWCSWLVLPHMKAAGYGRIVNIGADSVRNGLVDHAAYNAAKGGMHGMTTGLAREFARDGITVNTVAPCAIRTPQFDEVEAANPALIAAAVAIIPMGVRAPRTKSPRWSPISPARTPRSLPDR